MTVACVKCHGFVEVPCTPEQYRRWKDGELIQRAMPDIPAELLEILISGYCGPCFDALFAEVEEEESA